MKKVYFFLIILILKYKASKDLEEGIKWKADCGCAVDHIKSSNSDNYKENTGRFAYGKLLLMKLDYMFKRREKGIMLMIRTSKNDNSGIKMLTHRRIHSIKDVKTKSESLIPEAVCDTGNLKGFPPANLSLKIFPDINPNDEFEQEKFEKAALEFRENFYNAMEVIKKLGNENTVLDTYQLAKTVSLLDYKNFKKWETRDIGKRKAKEALDFYLQNYFLTDDELSANTDDMDPIERANIVYFMDVFKGVIYSSQKDLFPKAKFTYTNPYVMRGKDLDTWKAVLEKGKAQEFSLNKLLNKIAWGKDEKNKDCRLSFGYLTYEITVELKNGDTKYGYVSFFNQPQTKQTSHSFNIHYWFTGFLDAPYTKPTVLSGLMNRPTNISFNSGANNIKDEFEHSCRITIVAWKSFLQNGLSNLGYTLSDICGKLAINHPDDLPFMLEIPELEEDVYYYQFNCNEFYGFMNSVISKGNDYTNLIENLKAFHTRKDGSDEVVNPGELKEYLENLPFNCIDEPNPETDNDPKEWSKKRKVPLHEKPEKGKTIGIVRYKEKIILILRFWLRVKGEPDENGDLFPTSLNAKMCFEIEDFLTENIKTYYECFKYPEVKIPSENIPFDFLFIIYQPVLRIYYKKIKELNSRARYYIIPDDIYKYLFLFFREGNEKNTTKYFIIFENQMIQTFDGIYREFRLVGYEHVYFKVIIYHMNTYYYRIILRTGFREFEFYIKRYLEGDLDDKIPKLKKNFLEENYKDYITNFFDAVLYTHNQIEMKQIVSECFKTSNLGIDNFSNSGIMMYFYTDLISFPIIVVSIENILLDMNFKKIDIFRSKWEGEPSYPDLDPENVFISQTEYFFYTNNEASKEELLFPSFKWADLVIDKTIDDKDSILSSTLNTTFREYEKSKQNTYTFIYGIPEVSRKIQIVIFTFEEGFSPMLLIKFSCQFFIHEFLIPYGSLYELLPTLKSIFIEVKKNLMGYLLYFNEENEKQETTEDLLADELIQLIKDINVDLKNPLPLCMISLDKEDPDFNKNLNKTAAKFYIKKNLLFEKYFGEEKIDPEIKECDQTDNFISRNLAITISYTAVHNLPGFSIQIIEPYKNRGFNTILNKAIEVNSYVKDKTMISDYKVLKNYPFNHKHVVKIILKSALAHYLDEFDPIDVTLEQSLEKYIKGVKNEVD